MAWVILWVGLGLAVGLWVAATHGRSAATEYFAAYLLEESLTKLEEEFGERFVRVHRNCLVAREAIRGFERHVSSEGDAHWEVLLRDVAEALPVSRRQQYIVREIGRGDDA